MRPIILGVPSKGRLMEQTADSLKKVGFALERIGTERGYRGTLLGLDQIEVAFLSAAEIAQQLREGKIDLGVTGEDLLMEKSFDGEQPPAILHRFNFGYADVVVAVPSCWLDVATMADLDEVFESFYTNHGRRLRVATKYLNLTRRFFSDKGVTGYRIVESTGATEGAPAAGSAEIIVDITSTGSTLVANQLKILDDGVILRSSAVLAARIGLNTPAKINTLQEKLAVL